jgi:hypothetical protein
MTTDSVTALVKYDVDEAVLAATKAKCAEMTADTPKGYDEVRLAIAALRTTRVSIEKKRVELKADALAYGRLVDAEAKRLTGLVAEIEDPLSEKKRAIDDEKERVRREAEAEKLRAMEAEIAANRAKQEADAKAVRDAEEARMAAERRRLADERAAFEAERQKAEAAAAVERERLAAERRQEEDRQRVERDRLDAERRAIEAARQQAEREEFERQATIRAEKEAAERVEREKVEKARVEAELAALRPDLERVKVFIAAIRAIEAPKLRSPRLRDAVETVMQKLAENAKWLEVNGILLKGGSK